MQALPVSIGRRREELREFDGVLKIATTLRFAAVGREIGDKLRIDRPLRRVENGAFLGVDRRDRIAATKEYSGVHGERSPVTRVGL